MYQSDHNCFIYFLSTNSDSRNGQHVDLSPLVETFALSVNPWNKPSQINENHTYYTKLCSLYLNWVGGFSEWHGILLSSQAYFFFEIYRARFPKYDISSLASNNNYIGFFWESCSEGTIFAFQGIVFMRRRWCVRISPHTLWGNRCARFDTHNPFNKRTSSKI